MNRTNVITEKDYACLAEISQVEIRPSVKLMTPKVIGIPYGITALLLLAYVLLLLLNALLNWPTKKFLLGTAKQVGIENIIFVNGLTATGNIRGRFTGFCANDSSAGFVMPRDGSD
ncbi:PREDICTED: uncharacterized protein LOC108358854 [Rhagoletis zephyria]|uniref:uncharacterized protein LOC108358854 n=1 Tax=Rhagoletis zephyria TaxID=28612 RepID=UPI00081192EE|nr:PREDICTED: uncharacterized protein LOC108358854 [Rhagoletis zephyria]